MKVRLCFTFFSFFFGAVSAFSQLREGHIRTLSSVDSHMTLYRVSNLPTTDNVNGVYAQVLDAEIYHQLNSSNRFEFISLEQLPSNVNPSKEFIREKGYESGVDGFFSFRIVKGPKGVSIRGRLYLSVDGLPFLVEEVENLPIDTADKIREEFRKLYGRLVGKIPYEGLILHRDGELVTLNLGKVNGVREDQLLTIIRFIDWTRHPHFHFLVESKKEILGQIQITKVDRNLSFGTIRAEVQAGAIERGAKLSGLRPVVYAEDLKPILSKMSTGESLFLEEWVPVVAPQFGLIGMHLGAASYHYNVDFENTSNMSSQRSQAPSIHAEAELWLTDRWFSRLDLNQTFASVANPHAGGQPKELQISRLRSSLLFGYNILIRQDFWGPKFRLGLGFLNTRTRVDGSTPIALNATVYSGMYAHLGVNLPFDESLNWRLIAGFDYTFRPRFREVGGMYGRDPESAISELKIDLERKINENFYLIVSGKMESYKTDFGGSATIQGALSSSQSQTTLHIGTRYYF